MGKWPLTAFLCSLNVDPIADREFFHQFCWVLSGDDIPHIAPLVLGAPSGPTSHLHVFLGMANGPSASHLLQAITARVVKLLGLCSSSFKKVTSFQNKITYQHQLGLILKKKVEKKTSIPMLHVLAIRFYGFALGWH